MYTYFPTNAIMDDLYTVLSLALFCCWTGYVVVRLSTALADTVMPHHRRHHAAAAAANLVEESIADFLFFLTVLHFGLVLTHLASKLVLHALLTNYGKLHLGGGGVMNEKTKLGA